jgi:hypothetical protein
VQGPACRGLGKAGGFRASTKGEQREVMITSLFPQSFLTVCLSTVVVVVLSRCVGVQVCVSWACVLFALFMTIHRRAEFCFVPCSGITGIPVSFNYNILGPRQKQFVARHFWYC